MSGNWRISARLAAALLLAALPAAAAAGEAGADPTPTPTPTPTPAAALDLPDSLFACRWYGLYGPDGEKCGFGRLDFRRDGEAFVSEMELTIRLRAGEEVTELFLEGRRRYRLDGRLLSLYCRQLNRAFPEQIFYAAGEVRDGPDGPRLRLETAAGRAEPTISEREAPPERLAEILALPLAIAAGRVEAGDRFSYQAFEALPDWQALVTVTETVVEKRRATLGGVATAVYRCRREETELADERELVVDDQGRLLSLSILGDFTLRLEPDEATARRLDASLDLLRQFTLETAVELGDPRRLASLTLRLTGVPEQVELPDRPERQEARREADGSLLVRLRPESPPPPPGERGPAPDLAPWLAPTERLPCADEDFRALAAGITGGETEPYRAARLIAAWLRANLEQRFTPVPSGARETLAAGRGDCGEFSVLFVALARAAGVPAREVGGLALTADGFAGHVWVEVYAGRWVALDPMWGEDLVDASHVALAAGGLRELLQSSNLMARVGVEVLDHAVEPE